MEEVQGLVIRARHGDEGAWQALIERIYPLGLSHVRSLLRDQDLASDALQNALIKLYRNLDSLQDVSAFLAWWRRILTNEAYMILRLKQRETEGLQRLSINGLKCRNIECCLVNTPFLENQFRI